MDFIIKWAFSMVASLVVATGVHMIGADDLMVGWFGGTALISAANYYEHINK